MTQEGKKWLKSAEVRKELKISTCDLAHLRESGRLQARKEGNTYFYSAQDCARLRKDGSK